MGDFDSYTETATPADTDLFIFRKSGVGTRTIQKSNLISGGGKTFAKVVKSADETVNSSTTLQNDDHLVAALSANKTYGFMLVLFVTTDPTPDFKMAFTLPSGASGNITGGFFSSSSPVTLNTITASIPITFSSTAIACLPFVGRVLIAGTAGNMQLQWAQNTSDAANTTVNEGSFLVVWEE